MSQQTPPKGDIKPTTLPPSLLPRAIFPSFVNFFPPLPNHITPPNANVPSRQPEDESPPAVKRSTANVRERERMQQLATGFQTLRQTLTPWLSATTKMPKVAVLRVARLRIEYLKAVLDEDEKTIKETKTQLFEICPWLERAESATGDIDILHFPNV